jgi:hypothetical protein
MGFKEFIKLNEPYHIHHWVSAGLVPATVNPPYDCYCTRGMCRGVFKKSQATIQVDVNETIKQMKIRGEQTDWLQSVRELVNQRRLGC